MVGAEIDNMHPAVLLFQIIILLGHLGQVNPHFIYLF